MLPGDKLQEVQTARDQHTIFQIYYDYSNKDNTYFTISPFLLVNNSVYIDQHFSMDSKNVIVVKLLIIIFKVHE